MIEGAEVITTHKRCWEKGRVIEDPRHLDALIERRAAARPARRRDQIAGLSSEAAAYLSEVARKRKSLENEIRKLTRLVRIYGEDEVALGMKEALGARQFGAGYVRFFVDKLRFALGLGEAPEPIVTGNKRADSVTVQPHKLETYDALYGRPQRPQRQDTAESERETEEANGGKEADSDEPSGA